MPVDDTSEREAEAERTAAGLDDPGTRQQVTAVACSSDHVESGAVFHPARVVAFQLGPVAPLCAGAVQNVAYPHGWCVSDDASRSAPRDACRHCRDPRADRSFEILGAQERTGVAVHVAVPFVRGHVVRFRRSPQAKIVRSREPAYPAIVSVDTFTAVQLEERKRRAGGRRGWSSMERSRQANKRVYMLRSRIRCGICERKMEGATRRQVVTYYRCNARTLVPGSATALAHPPQIYLREDLITPAINRWIGELFSPLHRETTITTLLAADDSAERRLGRVRELQDRITAAEETMARLRRALDAGWDPAELREQYNLAVGEKRAAESALAAVPGEASVSRKELVAVIDGLGDTWLGRWTTSNQRNSRTCTPRSTYR